MPISAVSRDVVFVLGGYFDSDEFAVFQCYVSKFEFCYKFFVVCGSFAPVNFEVASYDAAEILADSLCLLVFAVKKNCAHCPRCIRTDGVV